ncbi:cyclase family protein [Methylocapsa sp. S129]|uniref:cyclase family protein n=1 Tax=Methylocapsa sp. S129 TaxID=1641869 RepID=UPI00131C7D27|nr:cyclase family protein [Methylocapsa sp. S129]
MSEKRVSFDFEIDFSNGGGIQGQGFRLDIEGDDISDERLTASIVRDMRLLMVGAVRILNKTIFEEPHKRAKLREAVDGDSPTRFVDLSHVIEDGMITYKGLPAPLVCDHMSFLQSRSSYDAGTEFQIGRIEMVANTGTYLDTPYHRYCDGVDLAGLPLDWTSDLPGVVVRVTGLTGRPIDWTHFASIAVSDRAVLVQTGWDAHWRTDRYFEGHPFLTEAAAIYLRDNGARLVGIDSLNIDDTTGKSRPVHSVLLGANIPIVEHLTNLGALPLEGFRFHASPPKIARMGTFPVRAHACIRA